jgi:hypothetical protein
MSIRNRVMTPHRAGPRPALAADDAGFITGANLPVNGGFFMDF